MSPDKAIIHRLIDTVNQAQWPEPPFDAHHQIARTVYEAFAPRLHAFFGAIQAALTTDTVTLDTPLPWGHRLVRFFRNIIRPVVFYLNDMVSIEYLLGNRRIIENLAGAVRRATENVVVATVAPAEKPVWDADPGHLGTWQFAPDGQIIRVRVRNLLATAWRFLDACRQVSQPSMRQLFLTDAEINHSVAVYADVYRKLAPKIQDLDATLTLMVNNLADPDTPLPMSDPVCQLWRDVRLPYFGKLNPLRVVTSIPLTKAEIGALTGRIATPFDHSAAADWWDQDAGTQFWYLVDDGSRSLTIRVATPRTAHAKWQTSAGWWRDRNQCAYVPDGFTPTAGDIQPDDPAFIPCPWPFPVAS